MIDFNSYIIEINLMHAEAKTIAAAYPAYEGKDKGVYDILGHITKYWNSGYSVTIEHLDFNKPSILRKHFLAILRGLNACPLLFIEKEGVLTLTMLKVANAVDTKAEPIKTRAGKLTQPYLLDSKGKIVKVVEKSPIKAWSVPVLFEVILQNNFFCRVLEMATDYDLEKVQEEVCDRVAKERKQKYADEHPVVKQKNKEENVKKKKETKKEEETESKKWKRPYIRIVSVPMGGMNKYKK